MIVVFMSVISHFQWKMIVWSGNFFIELHFNFLSLHPGSAHKFYLSILNHVFSYNNLLDVCVVDLQLRSLKRNLSRLILKKMEVAPL